MALESKKVTKTKSDQSDGQRSFTSHADQSDFVEQLEQEGHIQQLGQQGHDRERQCEPKYGHIQQQLLMQPFTSFPGLASEVVVTAIECTDDVYSTRSIGSAVSRYIVYVNGINTVRADLPTNSRTLNVVVDEFHAMAGGGNEGSPRLVQAVEFTDGVYSTRSVSWPESHDIVYVIGNNTVRAGLPTNSGTLNVRVDEFHPAEALIEMDGGGVYSTRSVGSAESHDIVYVIGNNTVRAGLPTNSSTLNVRLDEFHAAEALIGMAGGLEMLMQV